jgi:hypothetical protein
MTGTLYADCSFTVDYNGMAQIAKIGTTKINDNEYYTHLTVSFEHVLEPVGKDVMKLLLLNRMIYR